MDTKVQIDAAQALDALFQIVREEALSNPVFARRLLVAVGHEVVFRGEEALAAVDPLLVALSGAEEFRRTFLSMSMRDLKKIGREFNLFDPPETTRKTVAQVVELLWERASERKRDLFPSLRHAAE